MPEDREKELLAVFKSFKKEPKGSDENDLKASNNVTITFDPNGGIGGNGSQVFLAGKSKPLDGGIPTRSGYTFSYWNLNPEGTGTIFHNGMNITVGSSTKMYAVWWKSYE